MRGGCRKKSRSHINVHLIQIELMVQNSGLKRDKVNVKEAPYHSELR